MLSNRAYLCSICQCLLLSLFRTFIYLYIRCLVLSLLRNISISLFHTPVVSHIMVSSISYRSFVLQYLYSTVLCSPVSYVPQYLWPPGTYISQWCLFSSFRTFIDLPFVVSNFCYFVPSLFKKMFFMIVVAAIFD